MDVKQDELFEEMPHQPQPPQEMPVAENPEKEKPAEETPVEEMPVAETPAEENLEEEMPVAETPEEEMPVEETSVEEEVAADFGFDEGKTFSKYTTEDGYDSEIEPVTLPFPADEIREDGTVKTVRKRMLKKLLKYEYRYLLPALLCGAILLQVFAVFFGCQMRSAGET